MPSMNVSMNALIFSAMRWRIVFRSRIFGL